jgi:hypothetical protein
MVIAAAAKTANQKVLPRVADSISFSFMPCLFRRAVAEGGQMLDPSALASLAVFCARLRICTSNSLFSRR